MAPEIIRKLLLIFDPTTPSVARVIAKIIFGSDFRRRLRGARHLSLLPGAEAPGSYPAARRAGNDFWRSLSLSPFIARTVGENASLARKLICDLPVAATDALFKRTSYGAPTALL